MKIKAQIDRMVGENNRIKAYASVILGGEYVVLSPPLSFPHPSSVCTWSRMKHRTWRNLSTKAPAWCTRCSLRKKVPILAGLSALHRYPCTAELGDMTISGI